MKLNIKLVQNLFLLGLLTLTSCASMRTSKAPLLSEINMPKGEISVVNLTLKRSKLKEALANQDAIEKLRVIEVYALQGNATYPRYRIFDVGTKSIYSILGLHDSDVLLAVNDRMLMNPYVFKQSVRLLPLEKEAQIDIQRGPQQICFKYTFVDD